ncbi:Chitotriosidase-1 [Colletotrichum siamense]|uniref:Chitotriosidase-1 n=1 Tax=Colletotrichum siamense TaxID=690259 RepID=UPI00187330CA|nr:Chitotriosidase-1 [Colletotrichum siamense]KAF5510528.1 Chitotriosidase-1 [Colletotrichum siamense]
MQSRTGRLVALAISSFVFVCILTLNYGTPAYRRTNPYPNQLNNAKRASEERSWIDTIKLSPAHQNPAKAPHVATPEDVEFDSLLESSANLTSRQPHSLERRADGPLYCTDGPCVDGSCCGPKNISTDVYCHNADPLHGTLPCQAGYGSCAITGSPSCAQGSGSSKGRTIGYYQSWNARTRLCNRVTPKQLDTKGYTHLFFSFAFIDPAAFTIATAHPDDVSLMKEFTDLSKDGNLQTWIAIGGFDMSNPEAATHKTWSEMVASKENRAAFIASVKTYMDTHGFQGVDLDWEYPGAPERGGNKLADTRNLALLVKEMRAAYGTAYGISLTLAPDYWYLRWFDAKAMEPYVDFFGFMAYDLHGSWDADVLALGKKVRGQADIQEISKNTVPLWFDGLNPAKLNFGLAMYGRGYTLADPSCSDLLCPFSGPSNPAPCTNFEGVMSLVEIEQLIKRRNIKPKYLADSMMKQITWDDQWIGYDDEETFAAKRAFADGLCFGGTMIWSIDFQVPGSGGPDDDPEVVFLAPEVYSGTPAQCTGPCQLVLPPRALPSTTTITIPSYTTSVVIAPDLTTTLTIQIPPIVTQSMDYYNVNVTSGQIDSSTIVPLPSISIPPIVTTFILPGGLTQVRTLVVPPWPSVTEGPPAQWTSKDPSQGQSGFPIITVPPAGPPTITELPSTSKTPFTWDTDDDPEPTGTWPEVISVVPVETDVPDSGEDDDGEGPKHKSTCKVWFFWICVKWDDLDIHIGGLEWIIPPGIWGPGPPPPLRFPPNINIIGPLPPWPKITVHPGGSIEVPPKPASCTPAEASLCITTSSFATSVSAGTTKTTATQVNSRCATITGCNIQDVEATKTANACKLTRRAMQVPDLPEATHAPEKRLLVKRSEPSWCNEQDGSDGILLLSMPFSVTARAIVEGVLERRDTALKKREMKNGFEMIQAKHMGFTAFIHVTNLGPLAFDYFNSDEIDEVGRAYRMPSTTSSTGKRDEVEGSEDGSFAAIQEPRPSSHNITLAPLQLAPGTSKTKRFEGNDHYWHLSQISWPPNKYWFQKNGEHDPNDGKYTYQFSSPEGEGQTIYIIEGGWRGHVAADFDKQAKALTGGSWRPARQSSTFETEHGHLVANYAVGSKVGIARNADLVFVPRGPPGLRAEGFLEALTLICNDFTDEDTEEDKRNPKPRNSGVVNVSGGFAKNRDDPLTQLIYMLMKRMEQSYGITFVVAAGNQGEDDPTTVPGILVRELDGAFLVGYLNNAGWWVDSNAGDTWAPGEGLLVPPNEVFVSPQFSEGTATGSSFAAPLVAGLVAYVRGMHYGFGEDPASLKSIMQQVSRPLPLTEDEADFEQKEKMVWNLADPFEQCGSSQKRGLDSRQAACPIPNLPGGGNNPVPQGPRVTYKPGPPAPLCTADCGHLCSGYYCSPNPTGTPPDFAPPWETSRPTNTRPAESGGFGGGLTNLPTLTPAPTAAPPGQVCLSSTTATLCNGGPRGGVCVTSTSCASFGTTTSSIFHLPDLPTLGPAPSPSGGTCIKSETWTITGGPHGEATVTTAGCATWQVPGPTPAPAPPAPAPKPRCMAAHVYMSNCAFQPDSVNVQIWENGVEVCRTGGGKHWASDQTVFELECDNGAKAVVKNNARSFEYTAADGWKPEIFSVDYSYESTVCYQLDNKTIKGSDMESTWGGGNCGLCKAPSMCGLYTCKKNDVSCSS